MEIDSAMLAFGAETNANGLLHIFGGGFDSSEVGSLPGRCHHFGWLPELLPIVWRARSGT